MPVSNQIFSNNGTTLLTATLSDVGETMTGLSGSSNSFTEPKSTEFEIVTLDNGVDIEIVKVSKRVGTVFFISERALEGTTSVEFAVGTKVKGCSTSAVLTDLVHATYDISDAVKVQGLDYVALTGDVSSADSLAAAKMGVKEQIFTSPPICAGANSWVANTIYKTNSVVTPSTPNAHSYYALVGGTSGASEPTWETTDYVETIDSTITWVCLTPGEVTVNLPEYLMFTPTELGFIGQHDTTSVTTQPYMTFGIDTDTDKWFTTTITTKLTGPYASQKFDPINTEGSAILKAGVATLGDGATIGRFYWKGICIEYTHAIYNTVPSGTITSTSFIPTVVG